MEMKKWTRDAKTLILISRVADRFLTESNAPKIDVVMDLSCVNANGCKLDFEKLLKSSDFDFFHDVIGIRSKLNRDSGKLENCFLPRCAMTDKKTKGEK